MFVCIIVQEFFGKKKRKLLMMQSLARKMFHGSGGFIDVFMSSFQQGFLLGYHCFP